MPVETSSASAHGAEPALARFCPHGAARLPRISLGRFPTPVTELEHAGRAPVWVKRDDLTAPVYGGNKVRKLEFLLAEAERRGARRVITAGAMGSHHALATTLYATGRGLDVSLVLFPQTCTPHVREVLLMNHALGAELRFVGRMEAVPAGLWRARFAHRGARPVVIPPGGSDALGAIGYVNAALELAEQVAAGDVPEPDEIFVAAGTLGTVAGLAVGLELAGMKSRIAAVRITSPLVTNVRVLRSLIRGTARVLARAGFPAADAARSLGRVRLVHDQIGAGYGRVTPAAATAAERFESFGLDLDETYTGKAAAALLAALDGAAGRTRLYWHTLSAAAPLHLLQMDSPPLPASFQRYLDVA